MRVSILLVLTICLASALDVTGLPAGTRWIVQADVRAVVGGGLGPWLGRLAAREDLQPKVALLTSLTGLDPFKDLATVTLAGPDGRQSEAVVLLTGRFDRAKLELVAKASPGHRADRVRAHTVHRWVDAERTKESFACLVAGDAVLVFTATQPAMEAVLACLDQQAPTVDAARFAVGGPVPPAPVVLAAEGFDAWPGLQPEAALLRNLKAGAIGIGERGDLLTMQMRMLAAGERTATDVGSVIDGFLSLSRLDQKTREDPAWHAMVQSARLVRQGAVLTLDTSTPRVEFERSCERWIALEAARQAAPLARP